MDEITLLVAALGGLLTTILLFRVVTSFGKLNDKHNALYKDFHELNLFVRGVLSLPEDERPKPSKVTVEDLYAGNKTRRAIDEAVSVAASTWSKDSEGN